MLAPTLNVLKPVTPSVTTRVVAPVPTVNVFVPLMAVLPSKLIAPALEITNLAVLLVSNCKSFASLVPKMPVAPKLFPPCTNGAPVAVLSQSDNWFEAFLQSKVLVFAVPSELIVVLPFNVSVLLRVVAPVAVNVLAAVTAPFKLTAPDPVLNVPGPI